MKGLVSRHEKMPRPSRTLNCLPPSCPPDLHLLVLPVMVAIMTTDVLDACQKVVQELKWAQGQVKPYCWALPHPIHLYPNYGSA